MFYRDVTAFFSPNLWAEDSTVFLVQQRELGFASLGVPYAGYLHILPRTIALICGLFPLEYLPLAYLAFDVALTLGVCLYVCTRPWIPRLVGFLMGGVIVMVPHSGEVYLALCNLQWVVACTLPFLCWEPPFKTTWRFLGFSLMMVLVGLSGPFIVVLFPLFLIRLIRSVKSAKRNEILFFALASAVIAVQVYFILHQKPGTEAPQPFDSHWTDWADALFVRPFVYYLFGPALTDHLALFGKIFAPVLIGLLTFGAVTAKSPHRSVMCYFLLVAGIFNAGMLYRFLSNPCAASPFGGGARYFYQSYVFLASVCVWMAVVYQGWRRKTALVCLGLSLLSSASAFNMQPRSDFQWKNRVRMLNVQKRIVVPVNPEGWTVELHN
jgi:hypothetical protein